MATYIKVPETLPKRSVTPLRKRLLRPVAALTALLMMVGVVISSLFFSALTAEDSTALAFDPINHLACYYGEGSIPYQLEQLRSTDSFQFETRSKSVVTAGLEDVESHLNNAIISAAGGNYKKVNEAILGYALDGSDNNSIQEEDEEALAKNFNKGAKVNPYDRFGMAGMVFTNYSGEWRYLYVDICNTQADPVDMAAGEFYEGRLEPRSVWEDIPNSADPRTQKFDLSYNSQFWPGFLNLLANVSFFVTKGMVSLTVAFVNFSFSDIVSLMGIDKVLVGADGNGGVYKNLFSGLFFPLIVLVLVLTGIKIFYEGIVKQQFRQAFGTAALSMALFVAGILAAVNPALLVSVPNSAVVALQAAVVSSMNAGLTGGTGLCETHVGDVTDSSGSSDKSLLKKSAENMSSSISCSFWETFAFKPWVEGQWGTHWNNLWVKGEIPSWAPEGASSLKNSNKQMVGDAAVPMGGGTTLHNWAIFQVSTQTNAHAPIGRDGQMSQYSMSVANDWWRIVDAVSNYQEREVKTAPVVHGSPADEVSWTEPKPVPTLAEWDDWVGNNNGARLGTAMTSSIVALIGLAAPFVMGLLSIVYSIGMAILLAFAPVFLVLGAWGGKGFQVFKSWGLLLLSLMLGRIIVAALLVLSILFVIAGIKMMDELGWWAGIMMLVVLSVVVISMRKKVAEIFMATIPQSSFSQTASRFKDTTFGTVKNAGSIGLAAGAGAIAAKRQGMSFREGMSVGANNQVKNLTYRSNFGSLARMVYEDEKGVGRADNFDKLSRAQRTCIVCNDEISGKIDNVAYQTQNGLYICAECAREGKDVEYNAREVAIASRDDVQEERIAKKSREEKRAERRRMLTSDKSPTSGEAFNFVKNSDDMSSDKLAELVSSQLVDPIANALNSVRREEYDETAGNPARVPEELVSVVDENLIRKAIKTGNYGYVISEYAAAYVAVLTRSMKNNIWISGSDEERAALLDNVLGNIQQTNPELFQ